jgi:hypothetical protein
LESRTSVRHQVAKNIKKLYQQQSHTNQQYDRQTKEERIITQIKSKLTKNNAMISKADKGNSLVILYQDEYYKK